MEESVVPTGFNELRNQDNDRFIRILSFKLPDMVQDRRNHFPVWRLQNHQFRLRQTCFLDRGSDTTVPLRNKIPWVVLLLDMQDLNSAGQTAGGLQSHLHQSIWSLHRNDRHDL